LWQRKEIMALEEKLKNYQENIKQNPLTSVTIIIAVLLLLLIVIPYLDVNHRGINNATVEATLENQSRATFAQILGGAAIGIGLYNTWRRIGIAEEDLKATQESLKVTQENLKVSQEGQITERFTRAIDQLGEIDHLGNHALEIRLGGIYALERIADKSEEYYWPIMEILTAYVRKNSPVEIRRPQNKVSLDIQAILTIIGRLSYSHISEESNLLDLRRTYLQEADLSGVHIRNVDFNSTNLKGASLKGAILEKAILEETILEKAILEEATLKEVNLQEANLKGANLIGANFIGADLIGANFIGADLQRALLTKAKLGGANLENANLIGANFIGANLENANLKGAKNLTVDQLSEAKTLYKAKLDPELEIELRAKGFGNLIDDEPKR
jgi:uncharacterized protein YjbI with pentapeptide repeats